MRSQPRVSRSFPAALAAAAVLLCWAGPTTAQLNEQWVTFSRQNSQLDVPALSDPGHTAITDADTQVLFRTGDLDRDGWDDVVAVRKQQASQLGKRTAVLLMNVHGVLTDKTAQYATASDAGSGDQGFLTPCNNREVAIGDVNNDGWLDVVTSVALSDGSPKSISHPRVYMNLGRDPSGNWLGLRYEESRFPQLLTVTSPHAVAPRFCGVALGDVTGDGFADLYFVDYDSTETGITEAAADDLNDRFLRNDGNGYFIDESQTRFTTAQLKSQFGADCEIYDINQDGLLDIAKDTTLDAPRVVWGLYNNPADPGVFSAMGTSDLGGNMPAPYGLDLGDLNHDAFTDVVIIDDATDMYRLGTGTTGGAFNYATWGPKKAFTFIPGAGSDDGQARNVYLRDLDGDGWRDILITDVSGDLTGCGRRMHVYHNTGSVPGDMNLVLQEEAELATGNYGAGWKGVAGMLQSDLRGSYDVACDDFDHDGDLDLLVGTCTDTSFWRNETDPTVCQADLGFAGPGSAVLGVCSGAPLAKGYSATLKITGAAPSSTAFLVAGVSDNPSPLKGGTLVPVPIVLLAPVATSPAGTVTIPGIKGGGGPVSVYLQAIVMDGSQPQGFAFTNAVQLDLLASP